MSAPVTLDEATIDAIAERVAELVHGDGSMGTLVDAAEVARRFGVSRDYVYAHSDELGGVRLGSGPKAPLRFDPSKVAEGISPRPHPFTTPHRSKPRRTAATSDLLPIRGGTP